MDNLVFKEEPFDILLDDVQTTINDGIGIYMDNYLAMFIQNGKFYEGDAKENDLTKFDSSNYATLDSNFDTSRLVESASEPKIYGTDSDYIVIMPDNQTAYTKLPTFGTDSIEIGTIESHTPNEYSLNFEYQGSYFNANSEYEFIVNENEPVFVYNAETDAWHASGVDNNDDTYFWISVGGLSLYSGENADTILNEIESFNS